MKNLYLLLILITFTGLAKAQKFYGDGVVTGATR